MQDNRITSNLSYGCSNMTKTYLKMTSTNTYLYKWYSCAEHRASKLLIVIHCTASNAKSLRSCTVKIKKVHV
jgi:hypothetical protein